MAQTSFSDSAAVSHVLLLQTHSSAIGISSLPDGCRLLFVQSITAGSACLKKDAERLLWARESERTHARPPARAHVRARTCL